MSTPNNETSDIANLSEWVLLIFTISLMVVFMASIGLDPVVVIKQNSLLLLAVIIVILLSHRFTNLEVIGLFKLSKTVDKILDQKPSTPEHIETPPPQGAIGMNNEERVKALFNAGDYYASVSLLRNVMYEEIRHGLERRAISIPSGLKALRTKIESDAIYDRDVIRSVDYLEKLCRVLKKAPDSQLLINHDKFEEALDFIISRYFKILAMNEHPADRD